MFFYKKIKKSTLKLLNISLFKKIFLRFNFVNIFKIFKLNNFLKKKKITNSLIFNYKKISFIFLNNLNIFKKSEDKKINFSLIYILTLIHCILHSQNFKDKVFKDFKIINLIQNKLMIKYLYKYKCRL